MCIRVERSVRVAVVTTMKRLHRRLLMAHSLARVQNSEEVSGSGIVPYCLCRDGVSDVHEQQQREAAFVDSAGALWDDPALSISRQEEGTACNVLSIFLLFGG